MQLGMIGLGRMGGNIVRRLTRKGHDCVVFDQNPTAIEALVGKGVTGGTDLKHLVSQLQKPRAVWVMLPAGEITENTVQQLARLLEPGDTVIDGGNAFYKDDIRRAKLLKAKGIHYIDCGTSGGVWGLERGYSPDDRRRQGSRRSPRSDLQRRWRRARATFRPPPTAKAAIRASSAATCIAARAAPAASSR